MSLTTIVLADDHPVVRKGLRALLEGQADFRIVGEAADGPEAADLVERQRPDVLILDVVMPGLGGLEVTRLARQRSPQTRVIILSMYANEAYVVEALKNGASGYVLKDASPGELVQAVRQAIAGRRYLSPPLTERAIAAYIEKAQGTPVDPYETLTVRERQVLHQVAEGSTTGAIAARLSISPRTVDTHRTNIMQKLGMRTKVDLIRYAILRGIIPPDR